MAVSNLSPNVDNYFVGAGIVKWKEKLNLTPTTADTVSGDATVTLTSSAGLTATRTYSISGAGIPANSGFVMPASGLDVELINLTTGLPVNATSNNTNEAVVIDNTFRDLGNVSRFEFSSAVTRLKHYSSRVGTRFKDRDVVTQVDATVALTMEELTASNLAMALLGDETGSAPTDISILTKTTFEGALRMVGTNDVGAKVQVDLPSCLITPSGALGFINQGTWGEIQLTCEVNGDAVTGSFGTLAWNITNEIP
jgi:hypothetical protein